MSVLRVIVAWGLFDILVYPALGPAGTTAARSLHLTFKPSGWTSMGRWAPAGWWWWCVWWWPAEMWLLLQRQGWPAGKA